MTWRVIAYFDGPLSKWKRSAKNWQYQQHKNGVCVPCDPAMPEPDPREVLCVKEFKFECVAMIWAAYRIDGLSNVACEVRPL